MEPADAKELIDDAIERAEERQGREARAEHEQERRFRDRVSLMVGGFAVALAVVHMTAAGAQRDSLLKGIQASDTFAYMQAKIVRETVLKTAAAESSAAASERDAWRKEAVRLRRPDAAGHGITQLQTEGTKEREEGKRAATRGEGYELGETALQMAIVLLSIAMVARSRWIAIGAAAIASLGLGAVVLISAGILF